MLRRRTSFLCCLVIGILLVLSLGCMAEELPEVEITKVYVPPEIDGRLNDNAWVQAARSFTGVLAGWKTLWGDSLISNPRTAYMVYDDENLYVGMMAFVEDTSRLVKQSWDSDGLEVHLDIGSTFCQLGITFDGETKVNSAGISIDYEAATYVDEQYWSVEVAIPWSQLGIEPVASTTLRFNLAGWDYKNEWVTWGPSYGDFLVRDTYGYLILR